MVNYQQLEKFSTKEELIEIIKKMDRTMSDIHTNIEVMISENILLEKKNSELNEALESACVELAGAYNKYAKKPEDRMKKPENWKSKFLKR